MRPPAHRGLGLRPGGKWEIKEDEQLRRWKGENEFGSRTRRRPKRKGLCRGTDAAFDEFPSTCSGNEPVERQASQGRKKNKNALIRRFVWFSSDMKLHEKFEEV
jgi:hypothetical protein